MGKIKTIQGWPPKIIFNMDCNWAFNYATRHRIEDVARPIEFLSREGVDAFTVLVGVDDDLSWRGSKYGQLWGDNVKDWDPDKDSTRRAVGGMDMNAVKRIHEILANIIEDGHDLMQTYVDAAKNSDRLIYAGFRMNDNHASSEERGWYGRSAMKLNRPDLLIGSAPTTQTFDPGYNFSWQWDYAQLEVRQRFLGLFSETLSRYEFDGLELDFSRAPFYFKPGQAVENIPVMTEFVHDARDIVLGYSDSSGRPVRLLVRVPTSIGGTLGIGIDTEGWLREGLVDVVILGGPGYCTQEIDTRRAVQAAKKSGALVYTGFDSSTYMASPQDGHERNPSAVIRATALNGYSHGARGVHLFNYDYSSHRPGPIQSNDVVEVVSMTVAGGGGGYTKHDLQTIRDLADTDTLKRLNRCYYLEGEPVHSFNHVPQVPRRLALKDRGSGPGHALRFTVEDDINGGIDEGRIKGTELRLRFTDHEDHIDRINCVVNGYSMDIDLATKVTNVEGLEWLVLANPVINEGENTVLVELAGSRAPDPWPTLHNCELRVICEL